jgi:hypothetical protein
VGFQLYADLFNDSLLTRVATAYLKETGWNKKIPAFK